MNEVTVHTIYGGSDTFTMELSSLAEVTARGFLFFVDNDKTLHIFSPERIEYITVTNYDPKKVAFHDGI